MTGPSQTGRPRVLVRALANVGLMVVATLFAVLAAELAIRLVAPQQLIAVRPDVWQPVDTLGWTLRPNIRVVMNTGDGPANVLTDERGYRVGSSGPVESPHHVLLLGDSFMEALQVDHDESFAGLMERDLSDAVGSPVAVWNSAVRSWDPPQYFLRARQVLRRDTVGIVVTSVYLGNDVVSDTREYYPPLESMQIPTFRIPRNFSPGEWIEAVARPLNDRVEQRSHLFILLKNRAEVLRMRLGLTSAYFPPEFLKSTADSPRWDVTADVLAQIDQEAKACGIPSLFVIIPTQIQIDTAALQRYLSGFSIDPQTVDIDQPNRLLVERLARRGLEVHDITEALRRSHAAGQPAYGVVDTHFSRVGHRVMWESLGPRIGELARERFTGAGAPTSSAPCPP